MRITCYLLLLLCLGCREETEILPDNEPPVVDNVATLRIENYVNRLFVDLLGREPLDGELDAEVLALREGDLGTEAREALIVKLQTGTDFVEGDTSYARAYSQHLYNLCKIRCLEGVSNPVIRGEFIGLAKTPEDSVRLVRVLQIRAELESASITLHEAFARTIYNDVYDRINMNTSNFVEASFDNLLWRFPTNEEFQAGFNMVEYEMEESLFGATGSNRDNYVQLMTNDREMSEGLIIWAYQLSLARRPTTAETTALLDDFHQHRDLRLVQRTIMVTDEYAGF